MTLLNAERLTLKEVHQLLGLQKQPMGSYEARLSLGTLTATEQQELGQIAADFDRYLAADKVSEGLVKALTTFPLLRLAGFYRFPVELRLEEAIERIDIEEAGITITGRFDILAVNPAAASGSQPFWILVVEAKNSAIDVSAGLPQLLTYACKSLSDQSCVWGLIINGLNYQFVFLEPGAPPTYQLLPPLHLFEADRAVQLLQILKSICQLQGNLQSDPAVA